MRYFTVGETWGPLKPCACGKETWATLLTDEENARLPVKYGPGAIQFILDNKLGLDICSECAAKKFEEIILKGKV